mmetsp:Transcript_44684/g.83424  ORF Transcript_44684/g.83424 Transcript_44684/m.83424 type:complete len:291 (+) Transcript_44684:905-1777(+)
MAASVILIVPSSHYNRQSRIHRFLHRGVHDVGLAPSQRHGQHRGSVGVEPGVVLHHPINACHHVKSGSPSRARQHLYTVHRASRGHAERRARRHTRAERAVAAAVRRVVVVVHQVRALTHPARKLSVGGADARVQHVDVHPGARDARSVRAVQRQIGLVQAVQRPAGGGLHLVVWLYVLDLRCQTGAKCVNIRLRHRQQVRARSTPAAPHPARTPSTRVLLDARGVLMRRAIITRCGAVGACVVVAHRHQLCAREVGLELHNPAVFTVVKLQSPICIVEAGVDLTWQVEA